MNDIRAEELIARSIKRFHGGAVLDMPPERFRQSMAVARVRPAVSFAGALALCAVVIFSGVVGLVSINSLNQATDEPASSVLFYGQENQGDNAAEVLKIYGNSVSAPLTVGTLKGCAELKDSKKTNGGYTLTFCRKNTDQICFKAEADDISDECAVRRLYVKSEFAAACDVSVCGITVGSSTAQVIDDYYSGRARPAYLPKEIYQSGSFLYKRKGLDGFDISFEINDLNSVVTGIVITPAENNV